jgi:putative SbcD/Mre11-related phosphoesterase
MQVFGFKVMEDKPALYHPEMDLVVISDIHLGLEGNMTSKGSYIPQFQLEEMKQELVEIKQSTGAERILVNGDMKNQFSTSYTEKQEVEEFITFLKEKFQEVILIKGNHDTFLENTAEKHGLEMKRYFVEGSVLFIHGHEKIEEVEEEFSTVVIGHEHPALGLTDDVGVKEKVPCLLYGEVRDGLNLIVMPAYSKISNGSEVNNMPKNELLTPLLRESGVKDLKAIVISREAGRFKFPEISEIE